jgi:NTP pyrophosphatase (non-canonical NTP hydrolase)
MNLNQYSKFIASITSDQSTYLTSFADRLRELHNDTVNAPLLLTSAIGLGSETGEFQEVVKKIFFQGKPMTGDNIYHMKRELGDIFFYWISACRALEFDPQSVINENIHKLSARYPNGFQVENSENRAKGDI